MSETVFDQDAAHWWDTHGPFKMLHKMNPVRASFIENFAGCRNQTLLDIGCGGGILCEALTDLGAKVTGIDSSAASIDVARTHAEMENKKIHYYAEDFLSYAKKKYLSKSRFDIITALEMLEHVPDPDTYLSCMAQLLKADGRLVVSTINRNISSYWKGIVAAEYLLGWVQPGTHQHAQFIKPSELYDMTKKHGLDLLHIRGMSWDFSTKRFSLTDNVDLNYIAVFQKNATVT